MEGDTYSLLQLGSESTQNMLTEWLARCRPVCLLIFPLVFSRLKLIVGSSTPIWVARGGREASTPRKGIRAIRIHKHTLLRSFSLPHNLQTRLGTAFKQRPLEIRFAKEYYGCPHLQSIESSISILSMWNRKSEGPLLHFIEELGYQVGAGN